MSNTDKSRNAKWACRYIERFGFKLVPLLPSAKRPHRERWNEDDQLISTVEAARDYWGHEPNGNIGVCLEPSGLVSLDADDEKWTRAILEAEGISFDELMKCTPTIIGRAPRLEFSAPAGVVLGKKILRWPDPADPTKHNVIFEYRAGRGQDVLPPSTHPQTGAPYRWLVPPTSGFPPLPDRLLQLWLEFDTFEQRALALCPWRKPETPKPRPAAPHVPFSGPSVIAAFNETHDLGDVLKAHGYMTAGKGRWKSPYAKQGNAAGLVLLPDGKFFCHHGDDPLGDGKPHDQFDIYAIFNHGGDFTAAIREAAKLLELNTNTGCGQAVRT